MVVQALKTISISFPRLQSLKLGYVDELSPRGICYYYLGVLSSWTRPVLFYVHQCKTMCVLYVKIKCKVMGILYVEIYVSICISSVKMCVFHM